MGDLFQFLAFLIGKLFFAWLNLLNNNDDYFFQSFFLNLWNFFLHSFLYTKRKLKENFPLILKQEIRTFRKWRKKRRDDGGQKELRRKNSIKKLLDLNSKFSVEQMLEIIPVWRNKLIEE